MITKASSSASVPLISSPSGGGPTRSWAAVILFFALTLAVGAQTMEKPGTTRTLFLNSVGPIPAEAAPTLKPLKPEHLAGVLQIAVPLKMRNYPQLLDRIGRRVAPSPAELERDYLPLAEDAGKVKQWLESQGLTITRADSNNLAIFAKGTVAQIQQAFQVDFVRVTVEGTEYSAAQTHPSLPAGIAGPVLGVNGLQPFRHAHRHLLHPTPSATSEPQGYLVSQVKEAYNATNLGVTGAGQTIAILIDSVPLASDLQSFWSTNGISPNPTVQEVALNGALTTDSEGEATLDVEWSSSTAPGAIIRVYATNQLSFEDLDNGLAQIVSDVQNETLAVPIRTLSISLGLGEKYLSSSEVQTESNYFAALAAANVSVFVASGDAGSNPDSTGHNTDGPLQVEYEASDPSVTGVGGTNMYLGASGNVTSETGWSGSGGGLSIFFNRPAWQTGTGVPSGAGLSSTARAVPDVSLVASPNTPAYFVFQGQGQGVAGTSWATPTWAGFSALINQARANQSIGPLGLLNPLIYPLIGTNNFRDITSGSNGAYSCGTGYDMVTGIGVPNVANLIQTLSGASGSTGAPTISSFTPTSGSVTTTVVITGTNLSQATSVTFNGTSGSFLVSSSTQITAIVPTSATTGTISVATPNGTATSTASFTVTVAPPGNDNFANATPISGATSSATGTNVGATLQSGEPEIQGNPGGASIWYAWTAPSSGAYTFNTFGSKFSTLLGIYTGSSVSALTLVASDVTGGTGSQSAVSFAAAAGTIYYIKVDGVGGATGAVELNWAYDATDPTIDNFAPGTGAPGTIVAIYGANLGSATSVQFDGVAASFTVVNPFQLAATAPTGSNTGVIAVTNPTTTVTSAGVFKIINPPTNDNLANAQVLPGASGQVTGTNVGATLEPGEPEIEGNPGGHSVWYSWTPSASGPEEFNTFGSSFDTLLAVYTGSAVNALTLVAANNGGGAGFSSVVSFQAAANTTYFITVDGANGVTGNVVLNWNPISLPAITSFTPTSGSVGSVVTITGTGLSSVTAVTFGGVSANFAVDSDTAITVTVPTGAATGDLAVTNLAGTATSAASFTVSSAPGNDDFVNAYTITSGTAAQGTNVLATKETGEPNHAGNVGGASVWWNWTAPSNGLYTISTLGSNFDTLLGVYTGAAVNALTAVASDNGGETSGVTITAVSGTIYRIAVDGYNGGAGPAMGSILLSINPSSVNTLFSTGFESSQGYTLSSPLTGLPTLAGQNGWTSAGDGANGVVTGLSPQFSGLGQQGYIGNSMLSSGEPTYATYVWQPIDYTPQPGEIITFQVLLQIVDSDDGAYDDFAWQVFNQQGDNLFSVHFDNRRLQIRYGLDTSLVTGQTYRTGYTFSNQSAYTLQISMNFGQNTWSATVDGAQVVSNQPITTQGYPLNLGDVDAFWGIEEDGDNYMLFDNYSITTTGDVTPQILLGPQPLTVPVGSSASFSVVASGSQPLTYQWQQNQQNLPNQTASTLTLDNVQGGAIGSYTVVVSNNAGSVTSAAAMLTVTGVSLPNLLPSIPSGWSAPLVVTGIASSVTDDAQYVSGEPLYIDFAILNNGTVATPSGFQNALYIDGVLQNTWADTAPLAPGDYYEITGYPIGALSAGSHSLQIVANSTGAFAESNEDDNAYVKTVTVSSQSSSFNIVAVAAPSGEGTVMGGGEIPSGGTATLVATPNTGYVFDDWTVNGSVVSTTATYVINNVSASETVVANFSLTPGGPTVTITSPVSGATYTTLESSVTLAGTASSSAGIDTVTWSNTTTGQNGTATGKTNWTTGAIALKDGVNNLTVTATDATTPIPNQVVAELTVTRSTLAALAGTYRSLLATKGTPTYEGYSSIATTSTGSFTAAIWFEGVRSSLTGRIGADGTYTGTIHRPSLPSLSVSFTWNPAEPLSVSGTISNGTTSLVLLGTEAGYGTKSPWPRPGAYTFALEANTQELTSPQGQGAGRLTVTADGVVTVAARLADGATFSQSAYLAKGGILPLYASLYSTAGYIAGPVTLEQLTLSDLDGVADWYRPKIKNTGFPSFQTQLTVVGSEFVAGTTKAPVIPTGSRQLELAYGDLTSPLTPTVSFKAPSSLVVSPAGTDKLALTIGPATGWITGTFLDPISKKTTSIYAIILQKTDTAQGYFLSPAASATSSTTPSGSVQLGTP